LEAAMAYIDHATFRERAAEAAVAIAERIQGRNESVAAAMRKVLEVSANDAIKGRAQRVLDR
jgi:hypothetical protein